MTAPDSRRNYATVELARLFKWKKIATLNVALDYFSAVCYLFIAIVNMNLIGATYIRTSNAS